MKLETDGRGRRHCGYSGRGGGNWIGGLWRWGGVVILLYMCVEEGGSGEGEGERVGEWLSVLLVVGEPGAVLDTGSRRLVSLAT